MALNDEKMSAKDIILALNKLGGENGIGLLDIVENRLVGMKCRGVYETPGGTILYKAHQYLESLCLDKMTAHEKEKLAITFAELVYNGLWFSPLRKALSAFVDSTQEKVTGKVKLKLYKGNIIKAGAWSPNTLYSEKICTFGESDYNQPAHPGPGHGRAGSAVRNTPSGREPTFPAGFWHFRRIDAAAPQGLPLRGGGTRSVTERCAASKRRRRVSALCTHRNPAGNHWCGNTSPAVLDGEFYGASPLGISACADIPRILQSVSLRLTAPGSLGTVQTVGAYTSTFILP